MRSITTDGLAGFASLSRMKARLRIVLVCLVLVGPFLTGCSSTLQPESIGYGAVDSSIGYTAMSGATGFREMVKSAGARTSDVNLLSDRTKNLDTLFWFCTDLSTPSTEASSWINRWLSESPDKTLVFIGRDFSADLLYWKTLQETAAPGEMRNLRDRYARAINYFQSVLHDNEKNKNCPFFFITESKSEGTVSKFAGDWASDFDATKSTFVCNSILLPADQSPKADWMTYKKNALAELDEEIESLTEFSTGSEEEFENIEDRQDYRDAFEYLLDNKNSISSYAYLKTADGTPLVQSLHTPEWQGGRIVLVANASALSNVSLAFEGNRDFASKLIEETTTPNSRVGFLAANGQVYVRGEGEIDTSVKGFEMLTVWPLNLVSLHALGFGIIAIAALFPIFGRAKTLPKVPRLDFGNHVTALGALLSRTANRRFAVSQIKRYMERVRKERPAPWITNELQQHSDQQNHSNQQNTSRVDATATQSAAVETVPGERSAPDHQRSRDTNNTL